MKVLIVPHADYYVLPTDELRAEFPDVTFVEPQTPEERLREVVDSDAFYGTPTGAEMRAATRLRWIHNPGMGIDRLMKVPEIVASDVQITNAPGPHTNPMADHAFMFILALAHHLVESLDDQRQGVWDTVKYNHRMLPLDGSRLGILSMGGVGRAVAQRALPFGMHVHAMDPSPTDVPAGVRKVYPPEALDEMLRRHGLAGGHVAVHSGDCRSHQCRAHGAHARGLAHRRRVPGRDRERGRAGRGAAERSHCGRGHRRDGRRAAAVRQSAVDRAQHSSFRRTPRR